jgi:hypothetical protein
MTQTVQQLRNCYLTSFEEEYLNARLKHAAMNSSHEAYAVILEEVDEMWDAIKANDIGHARIEAIQIGAMILAFLMEIEEHD